MKFSLLFIFSRCIQWMFIGGGPSEMVSSQLFSALPMRYLYHICRVVVHEGRVSVSRGLSMLLQACIEMLSKRTRKHVQLKWGLGQSYLYYKLTCWEAENSERHSQVGKYDLNCLIWIIFWECFKPHQNKFMKC